MSRSAGGTKWESPVTDYDRVALISAIVFLISSIAPLSELHRAPVSVAPAAATTAQAVQQAAPVTETVADKPVEPVKAKPAMPDLTGTWIGTFTKKDDQIQGIQYSIQFQLEKEGEVYNGTVRRNLLQPMSGADAKRAKTTYKVLGGRTAEGQFEIRDQEFVSRLSDYSDSEGKFHLEYNAESGALEGDWVAFYGGDISGRVSMKRKPNN